MTQFFGYHYPQFRISVARIERSEIRDRPFPDFAALNPGYALRSIRLRAELLMHARIEMNIGS
jgi:hypothetical protein